MGTEETTESEFIDGKYRVIRKLGEGGCGTVYVCRHPTLDKVVAVKVMLENSDSASDLKRFHQEAQALSTCAHSSIISILAFGIADGHRPYFVMEFIDGVSLSEEIAANGPINPSKFLTVFDQILGALEHAHGAGLIHRDIKPSNIMVAKDERGEHRAVLIDFGLTRALNRDNKLTATDALLGTPFYMSPEQCSGGNVDQRSDIYSLGCTMFHAATGKPPFEGEPYEVLLAHVNQEPANYPKELAPLLQRCLAKNPENRFQNAAEARACLVGLGLEKQNAFSTDIVRGSTKPNEPQTTNRQLVLLLLVAGAAAVSLLGYFYLSTVHTDEKQNQSLTTTASLPIAIADSYRLKAGQAIQKLDVREEDLQKRLQLIKAAINQCRECRLHDFDFPAHVERGVVLKLLAEDLSKEAEYCVPLANEYRSLAATHDGADKTIYLSLAAALKNRFSSERAEAERLFVEGIEWSAKHEPPPQLYGAHAIHLYLGAFHNVGTPEYVRLSKQAYEFCKHVGPENSHSLMVSAQHVAAAYEARRNYAMAAEYFLKGAKAAGVHADYCLSQKNRESAIFDFHDCIEDYNQSARAFVKVSNFQSARSAINEAELSAQHHPSLATAPTVISALGRLREVKTQLLP